MPLLLAIFGIGGVALAAAILVFPYRIRFVKRVDRLAFILCSLLSGVVGAAMVGSSGAILWMSL
ncbi:MAG: hypothetical protein E6G94_13430 [Alphaproteobacteria bacterium]|nr:MAG: hypothetical protein E6G94_13430 [Alphaproteobacteria bacterium]